MTLFVFIFAIHADYILLKILAVKTRDKTTVKLLNHKLRYCTEIQKYCGFFFPWTTDVINSTIANPIRPTIPVVPVGPRFSRAVMVMVGAGGRLRF